MIKKKPSFKEINILVIFLVGIFIYDLYLLWGAINYSVIVYYALQSLSIFLAVIYIILLYRSSKEDKYELGRFEDEIWEEQVAETDRAKREGTGEVEDKTDRGSGEPEKES